MDEHDDTTLAQTTLDGLRRTVLTPPFAFVLACLLAPPLLEVWGQPLGEPLGVEYLGAWPVLLWTSIGLLVIAVTFKGGADAGFVERLSREDAWIAAWYFVNGMFFNSCMDVFAGQFQSWRTMTARYNELEPRYAMAGYDGITVFLTSWQEILIQTPCGLALFYAYWRGSNWKHGLEIIFNMWSIAGVWYFYGSEFVLGFPHVHAPWGAAGENGTWGPWDPSQAWTFETCWKFWIGFVIFPGLWVLVGLVLTWRACREIQRHVEISSIVMVQEELREILEQTDAQLWDEETALEEELAAEEQTSAGRGKRQQRKKKKKKN